jgi:hypothetical protein
MNPTQIFEFVMNWINQKIIKFNRVPLGRNHARPTTTTPARGKRPKNGGSPARGRPMAARHRWARRRSGRR